MTNGQDFYGQQQPYQQTQQYQQPYQQSYQQSAQSAQQVAYGQQAYADAYAQQAYAQQGYQQQAYAGYDASYDAAYQAQAQAQQTQYQPTEQLWPVVQTPDQQLQQPQKKRRRTLPIIIVLCAVLLCALGMLAYIGLSYWQGRSAYDTIATENVTLEQADPYDLSSFTVDWDALRAVNPDIIAWIYVPDTTINYPVVWRENDDNYYLYHNFNGYSSPQFAAEFGCIALSGANNPDFSDQINIICGHNMLDGSMFQPFSTFNDPEVFNAHRTIFLLTPKGNFRLNTFALDYVNGSSTVPINFATRAEFKEYLQERIDNSLVEPDPPAPLVRVINKAFAFYTCDNNNDTFRFFIYANIADYLPLDGGSKAEAMGNTGIDRSANPSDAPAGEGQNAEGAEGVEGDAQAEEGGALEGGAAVDAAVTERIV